MTCIMAGTFFKGAEGFVVIIGLSSSELEDSFLSVRFLSGLIVFVSVIECDSLLTRCSCDVLSLFLDLLFSSSESDDDEDEEEEEEANFFLN